MNKKSYLVVLSLLLLSFFSLSFASAWTLNGTVSDVNGNALNNTNVSVAVYAMGMGGPTIQFYNSTTSSSSGVFSLEVTDNFSYMYGITFIHRNATTNAVDYVGQSLPSFPYPVVAGGLSSNFYLQNAGTINISVINASNTVLSSGWAVQIKDTKLGYTVTCLGASGSDYLCYVPINRNYSIMLYPSSCQGPNCLHFVPVSFSWNNFSSSSDYSIGTLSNYNATTKTLNKRFNVTESFARITGYVQNSSGNDFADWSELTIVPFLLEPSNMIFMTYGMLPYNASAWNQGQSDQYNRTSGFYNITVPYNAEETVRYLFFAAGKNGTFYGGYKNITISGSVNNFNITMYGLLGSDSIINMSGSMGTNYVVNTTRQSFYFINATNNVTLSNFSAHVETKVDYSRYGSLEFTFMEDISSIGSATFSLPLLNISGFKEMNIYSQTFSPKSISSRTAAQISGANGNNLSMKSFRPETLNGAAGSNILIRIYASNDSCNVPEPSSNCIIQSSDGANFDPFSAVISGGKLNFLMGIGGVSVYYINVDLLASGPPDAVFQNNSDVNETTSGGFAKLMKFGSQGPKIYDYALVSMPYTEGTPTRLGLDESRNVNIKIPLLYDENWNVIWNVTANGTNPAALSGNYSHYAGRENEWGNLTQDKVCTRGTLTNANQINQTNPCYIDTINNKIWMRIPHFSGTGPEISGEGYSERYIGQDGIEFLTPTETSGAYLNRNYIWINVTSNLTNFANITIYLYNSSRNPNSSLTNSSYSTMLFNFSSLPDGLWFFNVTALNSSSWSNSTSTRNVTIDTIYPTITNGTRTESDASILNRNNIYINMSSSDTNLANITIYLYNSSRSLINSSNGTGASVAVNFTDLSDVDGLYYFNATACDRAGNCNSSFTTRSVILNASSPAVTAVSASSITSSGASISVTSNKSANITLSYGTTVSLGTNSSTNTFATSGSFSLSGLSASTTYYYNITICDRAGNCITNGTNSFTTSAASNETTTTTSGSGTAATVPVTVNLDAGYTKAMVVAETLNFKVGTESHSVFVQSLVGNILTLKIRSDPQIATFNVGDAKKFELNNDSYYDLYIKFNSIKSGAANLTIQTIHEAISTANAGLPTPPETVSPPAESPTDDDTRESEVSKVWIYVIIAVIILVAIVWYFIARKK